MKEMPFCQKSKFAKRLNENAFTLIEALFALAIFMIIIFFITPVFQIILSNQDSESKLQAMEWIDFCSQFKKEIRQTTKAEALSGKLFLTKDSETVQFDKYGTNLRRQVNSTGYEVVLQHVSAYSFSILNNAVKLTVDDFQGKEYSVTAYSVIDWNAGP